MSTECIKFHLILFITRTLVCLQDSFDKLMGLDLIIVQIAKLPVEPSILHVWTGNKLRDVQIKAFVDDVITLANTYLNVVDKKNVRPVHNSEMANNCIDISPFEIKPVDAFTHGSVPQ
jgi:hypothetical protein